MYSIISLVFSIGLSDGPMLLLTNVLSHEMKMSLLHEYYKHTQSRHIEREHGGLNTMSRKS